MNILLTLTNAHEALGRMSDHFRALVLLATRFYVGWQFWKSGWLKVTTVFGPGRIAIDTWLERRLAARCRPFTPAVPASSGVG